MKAETRDWLIDLINEKYATLKTTKEKQDFIEQLHEVEFEDLAFDLEDKLMIEKNERIELCKAHDEHWSDIMAMVKRGPNTKRKCL